MESGRQRRARRRRPFVETLSCPFSRALLVAVVGGLGGSSCATVGAQAANQAAAANCPIEPDPVSLAQLAPRLSRALREARANLMVSGQHPDYGKVSATLNHCRMALMEAILSEPKQAEEGSPEWLDRYLCAPFIEIRAERPGALSQGELYSSTLSDERGRVYPLLYLTERTRGMRRVYRLHYDGPLATKDDFGLTKVHLTLGSRFGAPMQLTWGVSTGNLRALDRLPYLFGLSRLRQLRQARRLALSGAFSEARRRLLELQQCSEQLAQQITPLLAALGADTPAVLHRQDEAKPSTKRDGAVHPVRLRIALWTRLEPLLARGLLASERLAEVIAPLREAAGLSLDGEVTAAQAKLLTNFDQGLARGLADSLSTRATTHPAADDLPSLPRSAIEAIDGKTISGDLNDRLARAMRRLMPRWIAANDAAPEWTLQQATSELRPVLTGEAEATGEGSVIAQTSRVMGPGWLHPGLPQRRYRVDLADYGGHYWRRRLERSAASELLAQIADEVVKRERSTPTLKGAPAASTGIPLLVRLRVPVRELDPQASLSELDSDSLARATASLARHLPAGNPQAIAVAKRWLGSRGVRRGIILDLLSHLRLEARTRARLLPQLRELAASPSLTSAAVRALVRLRAIAPPELERLYQQEKGLRATVIEFAPKSLAMRLIEPALEADDRSLRRAAAQRLAQLSGAKDRPRLRELSRDDDPYVAAAANSRLWQLGDADALLRLGRASRADCEAREVALPSLSKAMDPASRRRLLSGAIRSGCRALAERGWQLAAAEQPLDETLFVAALGSWWRSVRALAAISMVRATTSAN
jgi:hypothetical protein